MIVSKAEVTERYDIDANQVFYAKVKYMGMSELPINHCTPFLGGNEGGLVGAVPAEGTVILVCQPTGDDDWYYMGSTFDSEIVGLRDGARLESSKTEVSNRVTDYGGTTGAGIGDPHRIVFQDDFGNGLGLYYEKRGQGDMNIKSELSTGKGKRLALVDSPNTDCIIMEAGDSAEGVSKLTLTANPTSKGTPDNAYRLETTGPQQMINMESQTDIVVHNGGRELQLLNRASGWDGAASGAGVLAGNVNIQSYNRDVNVLATSQGEGASNIFIECPNASVENQLIQIRVAGDGTIRIQSGGKIEIAAGSQGLDVNSAGNLNINCNGSFNVNAGGAINMKAGGGDVGIQGAPNINLNPPAGVSPTAPTIGGSQNKYGSKGVTTY